ncbi:MAG: hypothetical protein LBS92_00715, partial [Candidatus Methanoplasma sp.]|nr:hypothetical protein [Candidatus Methanoplasma sp.]
MRMTGAYKAVGFFGVVQYSVIKDLTLEVASIDVTWSASSDNLYAGALIGTNLRAFNSNISTPCTVENVQVVLKGDITIKSSLAADRGNYNIGGMFGALWPGEVVSGSSVTGPGEVSVKVDSSYANENDGMSMGGFVGAVAGEVAYCYSDVRVGLEVSGYGGIASVGGFAGLANNPQALAQVHDNYARGAVSVVKDTLTGGTAYSNARVGGFAGYGLEVTRSYSTGAVVGPANNTGGFLGMVYPGSGASGASACFWDVETSGTSTGVGSGSSAEVVGETTANMKKSATFTAKSWDFSTVWGIDKMVNNGYPILRAFTSVVTAVADPALSSAATFAYTLDGGDTWTVGDSVAVPVGSPVQFKVNTLDGGYVHSYWSQSASSLLTYAGTVSAVTESGGDTLTAHFIEKSGAALLTVGSYPLDAGSFTFRINGLGGDRNYLGPVYLSNNSVVSVTAKAGSGYDFVTWSGGYGTNPASNNMALTADKNVTALFKFSDESLNKSMTLTAAPLGSGVFVFEIKTSDPHATYSDLFVYAGKVSMPEGTQLRITAAPGPNHVFLKWSDAYGTDPTTTAVLSADVSITGEFLDAFLVRATSSPSGGTFEFSVDGGAFAPADGDAVKIAKGSSVSILATPATGSTFLYWTEGTKVVSFEPEMPAQSPVLETTYVAHFSAAPVKVSAATLDPLKGGFVFSLDNNIFHEAPGSAVNVASGTTVYVKAVPKLTYVFGYWAGEYGTDPVAVATSPTTDVALVAYFATSASSYELKVDIDGADGTGRVKVTIGSNLPAVIGAGTFTLDGGVSVSLAALNTPTASFQFWSGAASSAVPGTVVLVDGSKEVVAHFGYLAATKSLSVVMSGTGAGAVGYQYSVDSHDVAGTISSDATIYAPAGTDVNLTASVAPSTSNVFVRWSGAVASSLSAKVVKLDANKSVTAHFGLLSDTVEVVISRAGSGRGGVKHSYYASAAVSETLDESVLPAAIRVPVNTDVTFEAVAVAPDVFVYWAGDLHTSSLTDALNVGDVDKTVVATFGTLSDTVALTLKISPAGRGDVKYSYVANMTGYDEDVTDVLYADAVIRIQKNATLTLAASTTSPNVFVYWDTSAGKVGSTPHTLSRASSSATVTAVFADNSSNTYVSVDVNKPSDSDGTIRWQYVNVDGAVVGGSGPFNVRKDTNVTFTATPAEDRVFVKWTVGSVVTGDNPYVLKTTEGVKVSATFGDSDDYFKVTVTTPLNGSVEWSYGADADKVAGTGSFYVPKDAKAAFTATAAAKYVFVKWTVVAKSDTYVTGVNPYAREITANTEIDVLFGSNGSGQYAHVTVDTPLNGSIEWWYGDGADKVAGTGSFYVLKNTDVTFTAKADTSYVFVKWSDGSGDGTHAKLVTADVTMAATFGIASGYALVTVDPPSNGSISWSYGSDADKVTGTG